MGAGNYYFSPPAGDGWSEMVYLSLSSDGFGYEDDKHSIYQALSDGFKVDVCEPKRWTEQIGDSKVLCEVGRMAICQAFTYYGDNMALIVTPKSELHDRIFAIENGHFEYETGWSKVLLKEMRAENARLARFKRSVESGALHREMVKTYETMTRYLHSHGFSDAMWFRNCAYTGRPYNGSDLCSANQVYLDSQKRPRRSTINSQANAMLSIHFAQT